MERIRLIHIFLLVHLATVIWQPILSRIKIEWLKKAEESGNELATDELLEIEEDLPGYYWQIL